MTGVCMCPQGVTSCRTLNTTQKQPEISDLEPPEEKKYQVEAYNQPKGNIYDNKPFKVRVEAGKEYLWCSCGWSKTQYESMGRKDGIHRICKKGRYVCCQPFCDGTHKFWYYRIKTKPLYFVAKETKDVWLCNCKQSNHRPFCDGTHKKEEIQNAPVRCMTKS
ncbi:CISD3 [Cordylochernes scorpioides]|uniref:CISD3 n=1 Tax=Cordylochernes scorpioides TaxID=51811 RepID=A0ABY6K2T0_9ARAC|nr:CISD3 [Cordylochernes scorpioides]